MGNERVKGREEWRKREEVQLGKEQEEGERDLSMFPLASKGAVDIFLGYCGRTRNH